MDIEALQTFVNLANTKNFTKTANQLFVAQSTVTNRISELEKELNFTLFSRNNRNVSLTREGEHFLIYAEKVLELTSTSLAEISSSSRFDNHLSIGSSDSVYEGHLAPIILKYQKKYPKDSLRISIGLSSQLIEQLEQDSLDVIFSYLPIKKAPFSCEVFMQDSMVLVTDIHNKKFENGITHKELLGEEYIMCNFALQDVGQYIRGLFPRFHQFSLEIDDCAKIIPFLIGTNTYTFLPQDMAKGYIENGKLRSIPLLDLETPVINSYIIGRKNKRPLWEKLFLA